ncbi:MAG: flagellar hook-associated protein FlgL [candidate division KSB1 bacterium]|nr:flagellar hook-associated protein FlgL [candidate division KSB1 bacterium]
MRVSHQEVFRTVACNINRPYEQMLKDEIQIATGKRVNVPSDDPSAAERAVEVRSKLVAIGQFRKAIADARSWLGHAETELNRVEELLTRAKSLAVQGANGTLSAADRRALAEEVDELLEDLVAAANGTYNDRYVFAGSATRLAPVVVRRDSTGKIVQVSFQSNSGAVRREIDADEYIDIRLPAHEIFGGDEGAFSALIQLRDALQNNRPDQVQATIGQVDKALEKSLEKRAEIGARITRLDHAQSRLDEQETQLTALLSDLEDVDVAQKVIDLQGHQMSYRAALAVGSVLIGESLLDYLG